MQLLGVGKRVFKNLTSSKAPALPPRYLKPGARALFARRDIETLAGRLKEPGV